MKNNAIRCMVFISFDFSRNNPEFVHQTENRFQSEISLNQLSINLLTYLNEQFNHDSIAYKKPLCPLRKGYERLLFEFQLENVHNDFSHPMILRLFQKEIPSLNCRFESIIQNTIASMQFPAPKVFNLCENKKILGGSFMIMEQMEGKNMGENTQNPFSILTMSRMLARIQKQLHSLETKQVIDALEQHGFDSNKYTLDGYIEEISNEIEQYSYNNYLKGFQWLEQKKPKYETKKVICHLDLHFGNIIIKNNKITGVVDWGNTMVGEPEFDVASTHILLDRIYRQTPLPIQIIAGFLRRNIIWQYQMEYRKHIPLDPYKLQYYGALHSFSKIVKILKYNPKKLGYGWIVTYFEKKFKEYTQKNLLPAI